MAVTGHGEAVARAARERALLRRYHRDGDAGAKEQLVADMLPLARALASRYGGRGEERDDLVQVACVGMLKAIDGFDLSRDVRLSSYAMPTIVGEIRRYFRDRTWAVRVPRSLQELQQRVSAAREELTTDLRRSPTVRELAEAVAGSEEDVLAAIEAGGARTSCSLSEPVGEEMTREDMLGSDDPELDRAELRVIVTDAFETLSERDQDIMRLRFEDDLTQSQIAARIGVSQMQISRIIRRSLARMRSHIERPATGSLVAAA